SFTAGKQSHFRRPASSHRHTKQAAGHGNAERSKREQSTDRRCKLLVAIWKIAVRLPLSALIEREVRKFLRHDQSKAPFDLLPRRFDRSPFGTNPTDPGTPVRQYGPDLVLNRSGRSVPTTRPSPTRRRRTDRLPKGAGKCRLGFVA